MSAYVKQTIRCRVDIDQPGKEPTVLGQSGVPIKWAKAGVLFQFSFYENDKICTVDRLANLNSVTFAVYDASRTGPSYMTATISGATIHTDVSEADWLDGSDAHVSFGFTKVQSALAVAVGQTSTDYWMLITATTTDDPTDPDDLGGGRIIALRDRDDNAGQIIGGNGVPTGATYDNAGHYVLNLTTNRTYDWVQGANDASLTNGTETIAVTLTSWVAQGATVTLNGTANEPVTAYVRNVGTLTPDEMDARFSRSGGGGSDAINGVVALGNGVNSRVVTGLALGFVPVGGRADILTPDGGVIMTASIDPATLSADGFIANFSGRTDSVNYKMSYTLF